MLKKNTCKWQWLLLLLGVVCEVCLSHDSHDSKDYLYAKPKYVKKEADPSKTRFTEEEKQLILQIHNSYRSLVEPPAADMRELVWDEDLEYYAWNLTQSCTGAHSQGTMVKKWQVDEPLSWVTWKYMGENLYYSYAPMYSIEEAMWMFWTEGQYYDIKEHKCEEDKTCGHYKVLTRAGGSRVGCAMNTCQHFSVSHYPTPAIFMACSYNSENLRYYRPYTVGERASHCNKKMIPTFRWARHGLCVNADLWFDEVGFDGNTSIVGIEPASTKKRTQVKSLDTSCDRT